MLYDGIRKPVYIHNVNCRGGNIYTANGGGGSEIRVVQVSYFALVRGDLDSPT